MKLTPVQGDGDWRKHLEGKIYQSHIRSYTTDTGDYGDYALFLLDGGVEDDTRILASLTISKRSKLGKIIKMLYPDYDFESEFDLDVLIGLPVAVTFEHTQREDGSWSEKASIIAAGDKDPKDYDDEAPF